MLTEQGSFFYFQCFLLTWIHLKEARLIRFHNYQVSGAWRAPSLTPTVREGASVCNPSRQVLPPFMSRCFCSSQREWQTETPGSLIPGAAFSLHPCFPKPHSSLNQKLFYILYSERNNYWYSWLFLIKCYQFMQSIGSAIFYLYFFVHLYFV